MPVNWLLVHLGFSVFLGLLQLIGCSFDSLGVCNKLLSLFSFFLCFCPHVFWVLVCDDSITSFNPHNVTIPNGASYKNSNAGLREPGM